MTDHNLKKDFKPGPVSPGLTLQQRFKAVGLGHCVWHIRDKRGFFFDESGAFRMLMRGGLQVGIDQYDWNKFLFSEDPKEWTIWTGQETLPKEYPRVDPAQLRIRGEIDDILDEANRGEE